MNDYYVYIYYRLDINEPFYVGKGHNDRWKRLNRRCNKHFNNIVNKCSVVCEIVKDNLTELEAFYWEEEIIRQLVFEYGFSIDIPNNRSNDHYCHLVNQTWGGEGTSGRNPFENKTTEEIEEIFSVFKEKFKGEGNPFYGKHHSEETRIKMKENHSRLKGEEHPLYGRKFTEEHKKNLSKAKKGKYIGKDHWKASAVICLTTKEIFNSISEASRFYHCSSSDMGYCCQGFRMRKGKKMKVKSAGKLPDGIPLVWRYLKWNHNKTYKIKRE